MSDEEAKKKVQRGSEYTSESMAALLSVAVLFDACHVDQFFPVPCLQPDAEQESMTAALAFFICGHIAAEKFSHQSMDVSVMRLLRG
jgi:hypothetical protein